MSTETRMGTPDWERFLKYVEKQDDGCWLWIGAIRGNGRNEYGGFWCNGKTHRAHIVAYVWTYEEPNADLHHTCERTLCVNPEHVTPATAGQSRHRGPSPNYCAHDHEFTPGNTYISPDGYRQCRTCRTRVALASQERHRDAINARRRAKREHVAYDPRPCLNCGTVFTPLRSTGRYCQSRYCINQRQIQNRERRLGRH